MDIAKVQEGPVLNIVVRGRLETATAPQLDAEVKGLPAEIMDLTFDFTDLEYVSSAGLRVILMAQKAMTARKAVFKLAGVNATVKKVLDLTGFSPLLTFV